MIRQPAELDGRDGNDRHNGGRDPVEEGLHGRDAMEVDVEIPNGDDEDEGRFMESQEFPCTP